MTCDAAYEANHPGRTVDAKRRQRSLTLSETAKLWEFQKAAVIDAEEAHRDAMIATRLASWGVHLYYDHQEAKRREFAALAHAARRQSCR